MSSDSLSSRDGDAAVEELTVNLQIVSPSVGVTRLLFTDLVSTTTIKQLKERIRQTLPLRPADDHQRLIHRGRALVRDTDTILDVLGEDAVSSTCYSAGNSMSTNVYATGSVAGAADYTLGG